MSLEAPPTLLPSGEVHLALVDSKEPLAPDDTDRLIALLDSTELARYHRFLPDESKHQFLITHALVRTELSRYAPLEPDAWRFAANSHGRPQIAGRPELSWLRFNLSNTRGLIACALAREVEVGVDVEDTSERRSALEVAERFFSPGEVTDLFALPVERQRDRFFDYWTLKESYIKARGMGLAIPLDRFTFRLADGQPIRLETDRSLNDVGQTWQFWQASPLPHHRLAVAVRRGPSSEFQLLTSWREAAQLGP